MPPPCPVNSSNLQDSDLPSAALRTTIQRPYVPFTEANPYLMLKVSQKWPLIRALIPESGTDKIV